MKNQCEKGTMPTAGGIALLIFIASLPVLFVLGVLVFVWISAIFFEPVASAQRDIDEVYERVERYGGVELPQGATLVYDMNFFDNFHGDGEEYMVVSYGQDIDYFVVDFSPEKSDYVENRFSDAMKGLESQLDLTIPSEYYPEWDSEYLWLQTQTDIDQQMWFAYFPQEARLYMLLRIS